MYVDNRCNNSLIIVSNHITTWYINRTKTRQCLLCTFNKMRIGKMIVWLGYMCNCSCMQFLDGLDEVGIICIKISYNSEIAQEDCTYVRVCNGYYGIIWSLIFFHIFPDFWYKYFIVGACSFISKIIETGFKYYEIISTRSRIHIKIALMLQMCTWYYGIICGFDLVFQTFLD